MAAKFPYYLLADSPGSRWPREPRGSHPASRRGELGERRRRLILDF